MAPHLNKEGSLYGQEGRGRTEPELPSARKHKLGAARGRN